MARSCSGKQHPQSTSRPVFYSLDGKRHKLEQYKSNHLLVHSARAVGNTMDNLNQYFLLRRRETGCWSVVFQRTGPTLSYAGDECREQVLKTIGCLSSDNEAYCTGSCEYSTMFPRDSTAGSFSNTCDKYSKVKVEKNTTPTYASPISFHSRR